MTNNSNCRSCLSTMQLQSIFLENIDQIYTSLTSIEIPVEDPLSKSICFTCSDMLHKFETFRKICWQSHTALKKTLASDMDHKVDVAGIKIEPKTHTAAEYVEVTANAEILKISKREELNLIRKKCEVNGQFQCPDCKKTFPKFASLRVHAKRHIKKCFCEICGEVLACQRTLRNHKMTTHTDESITRRFICGYCPEKRFKFKAQLVEHMHAKHIGERNFICDTCSVAFKSKKMLSKHIYYIHVLEKTFSCNFCELKFKTKSQMTIHSGSHLNVKNHLCPLCSGAFRQKITLAKHLKSHRVRRTYQCKFCSRLLTKLCILRAHTQKMHPDMVEQQNYARLKNTELVEYNGEWLYQANND